VTPWTNRVDELATIEAAVADATRGTGQAVALAGEPGIGKTRLAEEAIRHAERAGFRVLRGRGFEDELRAPYALFVESVRSFLRDAPKSLLDRVSEHCASEILSLVPELRDRLGPVPPGPELDPEAARLQFFEGITRFFQNLAREAPLLLLLDDLQWADPGSLALLEYLGPRIQDHRLLLLLTYRDVEAEPGGALHKVLSNLRRARFLREVVLRRFDVGAVRQLVEAILGSDDPVPELIPLLVEKSGGNPFFVEELLRSLIEEGILLRTVDGWQRKALAKIEIPSTVREVLRRRVERVGKEAVAVLAVASVFGGEFGFDLLRRVSGVEEEKLLHLVEAMLRARLLREREVSPGVSVLRFNDEQIRDVLYGEMSAVRRRRYHGQAAEALESMRRALPRFAALPMSTMV
jgi:predicted ATPase